PLGALDPPLALFFFSSRRRHTRSKRDWSSDVCSSDLKAIFTIVYFLVMLIPSYLSRRWLWTAVCKAGGTTPKELRAKIGKAEERSEERRVGRERGCGWRGQEGKERVYDRGAEQGE